MAYKGLILLLCILSFFIYEINCFDGTMKAQCYYKTSNKTIFCNSTKETAECDATIEGLAKKFKIFAIGEIKSNGGHHPTQWFHLFPKKLNGNGWWYYKGKNHDKPSHGKILLHTQDKHESNVEGFEINNVVCWGKLHEIITSTGKIEKIEVDKDLKSLFHDRYENVKIIGF